MTKERNSYLRLYSARPKLELLVILTQVYCGMLPNIWHRAKRQIYDGVRPRRRAAFPRGMRPKRGRQPSRSRAGDATQEFSCCSSLLRCIAHSQVNATLLNAGLDDAAFFDKADDTGIRGLRRDDVFALAGGVPMTIVERAK